MMDNPFPDRVIVSTATKIKLIRSLSEFWSLKSLFVQAKTNPVLLASADFQDKALEYFEKSSNIARQKFWQSLSLEARKKAAKYFVLQDVKDTSNARMDATRDSAAVYIVLNGTATVKFSDSTEEKMYSTGEIFGAVDIFDKIVEGNEEIDESQYYKRKTTNPRVMTANMKKGTYLRISLADFYHHVLSTDNVEKGIDEEEYSKIAEIPWSELTEEDKKFIEIYKHTKTIVRKDLFDFMSAFKLVPTNSRVKSAKYYKEGSAGKKIELHMKDPTSIFILLSGAMRIEIETNRSKEEDKHFVACKRVGKKPMVVKTFVMPLLLIETGAMLCLQRECFEVGNEEEGKNEEEKVAAEVYGVDLGEPSLASIENSVECGSVRSLSPIGKRPSDIVDLPSLPSTTSNSNITSKSNKKNKDDSTELYKIRIIFEKSTTYLQIPYKQFMKCLEEKIVIRSLSQSIRGQLDNSADVIRRRLKILQPWITGSLSFKGPPLLNSIGDYSATPLDDNLLTAQMEKTKKKNLKTPLGSFAFARLDHSTDSTVSTITNDASISSRKFQNNSRVSSIISKLKIQTKTLKKMQKRQRKREMKSFVTEPLELIEEEEETIPLSSKATEHGVEVEPPAPMFMSRSRSRALSVASNRSMKPFSLSKIEENEVN